MTFDRCTLSKYSDLEIGPKMEMKVKWLSYIYVLCIAISCMIHKVTIVD